MEEIEQQIKLNRPTLGQSSLKTYKSILSSIHKKCFAEQPISVENFENVEVIMEHLKTVPYNKRKTILAALVVLTENQTFREQMMDDIKEHKENELEQKASEKQMKNMITFAEVKKTVNLYERNTMKLYKLEDVDMTDIQQIQLYILLVLTTGVYIAPRRSMDWSEMKWREYDVETDNYYERETGTFVFNKYKTVNKYGKQSIVAPLRLRRILEDWFLYNPTDYVMFGETYEKLSCPQITHRLNLIFGKQISTSMLRHIYLTKQYGKINLKNMTSLAEQMGHSPMQALAYVKHSDSESD